MTFCFTRHRAGRDRHGVGRVHRLRARPRATSRPTRSARLGSAEAGAATGATPYLMHQVHGADVHLVEDGPTDAVPDADALVTGRRRRRAAGPRRRLRPGAAGRRRPGRSARRTRAARGYAGASSPRPSRGCAAARRRRPARPGSARTSAAAATRCPTAMRDEVAAAVARHPRRPRRGARRRSTSAPGVLRPARRRRGPGRRGRRLHPRGRRRCTPTAATAPRPAGSPAWSGGRVVSRRDEIAANLETVRGRIAARLRRRRPRRRTTSASSW